MGFPSMSAQKFLTTSCLYALSGLALHAALTCPQAMAQGPVLPGAPSETQASEGTTPDFFGTDGPASALGAPGEAGDIVGIDGQATPKSEEELKEEVRKEAYDAAIESLLPLRPEEIRTLLERFDRTQESVVLPVYPAPKPEVAVETLSLDPGAKPAVVKTAQGVVTTMSLLDVSGEPWPIQDISWAGDFEIVDAGGEGEGAHILRISPQSEFATGNMSIRLLSLKTPVIISLETSREVVHYRFDAIVPEYGPMAETPLMEGAITTVAGGPELSNVLQGIMPENAKKLSVTGVDARTTAYSVGGQTYLRTPLTLLSPSWNNSVASADGMRVYTIKDASVLLLSDKGKMVRAHLSEREDIFDE